MYKVYSQQHQKYGKVVIIEPAEDGEYKTPFLATQGALTMRRLCKDTDQKIRFLIDHQVMTIHKMEQWAREEYLSLPKCGWCAKILAGEVHTHRVSGSHLFCSQSCADKWYMEEMEKLRNEEEIEL